MRLTLLSVLLVACDGDKGETPDTTAGDDTGEGGGGSVWSAAGSGTAYFADGAEDNSLFHLELGRCEPPAEGKAYFGFVSRGGEDPIALGEIPVTGEDVIYDGETGVNAIVEGYYTFEAWHNDSGVLGEGDPLWAGEIDTTVYAVIQNLLIASDSTPEGEGSLRSLETTVQDIRDDALAVIGTSPGVDALNDAGEGYYNAINGTETDLNGGGAVVYGEHLPILGETGYLELIFADFDAASGELEPGDPVKELVADAYDCAQRIEDYASAASLHAQIAAVSAADTTAQAEIYDMSDQLGYALDGYDDDEDGSIDVATEGTIECAVDYVSQMAQMAVNHR
ncbi:MAG: hypothetical protein ACOZNI_18985 [Myxococcota bacterium]